MELIQFIGGVLILIGCIGLFLLIREPYPQSIEPEFKFGPELPPLKIAQSEDGGCEGCFFHSNHRDCTKEDIRQILCLPGEVLRDTDNRIIELNHHIIFVYEEKE